MQVACQHSDIALMPTFPISQKQEQLRGEMREEVRDRNVPLRQDQLPQHYAVGKTPIHPCLSRKLQHGTETLTRDKDGES